nr:helix-turn-helix domain-containing protein [Polyangium aurulentum]
MSRTPRSDALAEVAERVGYGSASTFSTAFRRHVGQPPSRYARVVLDPAQGTAISTGVS